MENPGEIRALNYNDFKRQLYRDICLDRHTGTAYFLFILLIYQV